MARPAVTVPSVSKAPRSQGNAKKIYTRPVAHPPRRG
jgi:hypothetical protein